MQILSDCLPQNVSALTPSTANLPTSEQALAQTATRTLWVRMAEIYGHRWTSAYGDNPNEGAAQTWAKGLGGIHPRQLADGLRNCLASADPWPPTLPEFRAMCLSIPTLAAVKLEIRATEHSQFTRAVWANIDTYRYRQSSAEVSDRMLRDAYDLTREQVMRGQPLPEPSMAIEQEKREFKPASPDVVAAAKAAIAETLGVDRKSAAAGPDA